ncbi:MAG: glycosyltransferase [Bacteroidetes bacterium]|nr:glycosyltransferase [Bacteroidota bacterium]
MQTVSIITVVYNAKDLLAKTFESVFAQDYPGIEYIVVDGASGDGTTDLIRENQKNIDTWISEPDKGLYDAMSKALHLATGDFVWFVNAGDLIPQSDTLSRIMEKADTETDVLYGEVMIVDKDWQDLGTRSERTTRKLPENLHWKQLRFGMLVCHQGFIARRKLAGPYMEDNWVADLDWVINILKKSRKNTFVRDVLFAKFQEGGVSTQKRNASLKDRFAILRKHYGLIPNLMAHAWILIRAFLFSFKGNQRRRNTDIS